MRLERLAAIALSVGLACVSYAQDAPASKPADQPQASAQSTAPAAPAAPSPLPTPAITGPLQASPPIPLSGNEASPLGKLSLNGIVSGMGLFQGNAVPGNNGAEGAL